VSIAAAKPRPRGVRRSGPVRRAPPVRHHLGLGIGPHHCPAFSFVPAIARTALDVLLDRVNDIQPEPGWQPAPHGWKLRLPGPLDLTWKECDA